MPLFVCDKCNIVENTALSNYWMRKNKNECLCSQCDPEIKKWHNKFSRIKYNPDVHSKVRNR